jgi:hypothetical protein
MTDKAKAKPGAMPAEKFEGHRLPLSDRIKGASFLGGAWYAPDGSPLTDKEAQLAHRAMDKRAAEARERAVLGRSE